MGSRYLTDLAEVVRSSGLVVFEVNGWQSRSRSSGGFNDGQPDHLMAHHTASPASADGWPDANYMCYSSDIRPVANLLLARDAAVYVMAAGATNTNGSGSDPCGMMANDSMNTRAIGVEAGNDGVGEPWPQVQQEGYVALCQALCAHYGIATSRIHSHAEYAPTRKIDPAGPSRWSPHPTGGSGGNMWSMPDFRRDVAAAPGPGPGPGPTPPPIDFGGYDVAYYKDDRAVGWQIWVQAVDKNGNAWTCPINDLPDGGKWHLVQPIVGDPPQRPFGAMVGLMDAQNRPG